MSDFIRRYIKKTIVIILIALILCFWIAHSRLWNTAIKNSPSMTIKIASVTQKKAADQFSAIGTVKALQGTDISSSTAGKITRIQFTSGQTVQKNQVLFTLQNDDLVAAVKQDQAKYLYEKAQYNRFSILAKKGIEPKASLDLQRSTMDQAEAQVEHDQALLNKTIITAPFSGTLGVLQASVGQYITAGQPIVSIQDNSVLYVDFYVPERVSDLVKVGNPINAVSKQSSNYQWSGIVQAVSSSMDSDTRNLLVRAKINAPYLNLVPGMYVNVSAIISSIKPLLVIPQQAVVYNPYGNVIYLYQNGKVKQHPVELGNRIDDDIVVLSGLQIGEQVVIEGQNKLYNGATVQLEKEKKS